MNQQIGKMEQIIRGQKKVAIARPSKKFTISSLDEATSSLDSRSENKINQSLDT